MLEISQGDVFDYDFGPQHDSRQQGKRPAVVVQTDHLNRLDGYSLTIIVPVTRKGRESPSHVRIEPSTANGLSEVSFVKCEQIFTIPKDLLLTKRGAVAPGDMFQVKDALRKVLSL